VGHLEMSEQDDRRPAHMTRSRANISLSNNHFEDENIPVFVAHLRQMVQRYYSEALEDEKCPDVRVYCLDEDSGLTWDYSLTEFKNINDNQ
jgi:hypothetical protein